MKTKIIKVNSLKPEKARIEEAAKIIKNGDLVAFPTETVYGLGADAFNQKAIKKIFKVKKRPLDNPIIVHLGNKNDLYKLVKEIPSLAKKLIKKFWPGPLTIILKRKRDVPKEISAGLPTIAIRMPKNKIALSLIKMANCPIAAPSANLSGRPSPTSAQDVFEDLKGKIKLILDGGQTKIGLESTVIDLVTTRPTLLRPGGVPLEEIEKTIGEIKIHPSVLKKIKIRKIKSPGMKYRHYAPKAELIFVVGEEKKAISKIREILKELIKKNKKTGLISWQKELKPKNVIVKFLGKNPKKVAKKLFSSLREMDKKKVEIILGYSFPKKGFGLAINNRLKKAASKIIKV